MRLGPLATGCSYGLRNDVGKHKFLKDDGLSFYARAGGVVGGSRMHRDEDDTMKANAHPFSTRRGRRARLSAEAEGALTVPEPDERLVGHDELSPAGLAAADDGVCV